ncbi:MAG: ABC transporter substrate-binding protein [Acidimicrobiales bacterium]
MRIVRTQCNWELNAQFAGWIVAQRAGLFAAVELHAETVPHTGHLTEPAVLAGAATFGVSGSISRVVRAAPAGILTVLGAQFTSLPVGLLGLGRRQAVLSDLADACVGVPVSAVELEALLAQTGYRAPTMVTVGGSGVSALLDGSVDLLWAYAFNQPLDLAKLGVDHIFTPLSSLGATEPGGVVFCRTATLREETLVVAYLAAVLAGWRRALEDPAATAEQVAASTPDLQTARQLSVLRAQRPYLASPVWAVGDLVAMVGERERRRALLAEGIYDEALDLARTIGGPPPSDVEH